MKKNIVAGTALALLLGAAAIPAFADSTSTASSTSNGSHQVNLACVQAAVDKRETSVASAFDALTTSLKSALSTRSSALHAAWGMTNKTDIKNGVKKAWSDYRASSKTARKTWNSAVKADWKQFRTDRKACGPNAGVEEDAGQGSELSL